MRLTDHGEFDEAISSAGLWHALRDTSELARFDSGLGVILLPDP